MKTKNILAISFLATLAFVFGSVNTVNTHDTILIKGNYAWEVKVFPASDCKATIEENEHPKCAYHVVKKGETLSRIAVRYSAKDYRMTVENILATGKNRTEIAKRVTPRLKKISAKEGHWIFEGQVIFLPLSTTTEIAAAKAMEAVAKKSAQGVQNVGLSELERVMWIFIAVLVLVMVYGMISIYRKLKRYSAPRTPQDRENAINPKDWKMDEQDKTEGPDKKTKPSDWNDWAPKILLIGFTLFALTSNAYAGEISGILIDFGYFGLLTRPDFIMGILTIVLSVKNEKC
ncbi:MAG: hypothetical protein UX07_C0007G0013 [Parcubacteria group bacterium GW2011_GWA2_45_30]|nr:MAG: hypothetical protein UX07_C0007G0013 [Parcubacteria group bacterium GW2011_GWA2_45_30]